jgi:ATP-dependent Clp protease ATP-binding subunit ClpC
MAMDFNKYTEKAQEALMLSQAIMQRYQHSQLDTDHLILAMLEQPDGTVPKILEETRVDPIRLADAVRRSLDRLPKVQGGGAGRQAQVYPTPAAQRVLGSLCWQVVERMKDEYVATEHLLLAIIEEGSSAGARILREHGLTREAIEQALVAIRGSQRVMDPGAEGKYQVLEKYSRDLTQAAREGKLDPVIGRDEEIRRVIEILSRRTKNNPALIGEPGVGKTAIVEGLAQAIIENNVPQTLKNKRVIALDLSSMVAGSKFRGEFEERLKAVMDEIRRAQGEIVLFVDELHTVVGAGAAEGAIDASNMLKPALARGELQCVGATTLDEYRKHIEKDPALERRFQPVVVNEPSVAATIQILQGLIGRYEQHHQVTYTPEAIEAAATLSARYLTERFLPDKAIDLIDEAGARRHIQAIFIPGDIRELETKILALETQRDEAALQQNYQEAARIQQEIMRLRAEVTEREKNQPQLAEPVVTQEDIAELIARATGIPVTKMFAEEAERLLNLEAELHKRVIDQAHAVQVIAEAIRRARAGLKDPKRPIGSFIFMGPTGVGKTELARALAAYLFEDEEAMVRIDMSEYMEKHAVSRLIGAPPGYVGFEEGGQLTEAVRRRPYRVILFDEIEKAHPDVFNILLQVLEDGRLTDNVGRTVDFRNTLIIMTSNVGSQHALTHPQPIGFIPDEEPLGGEQDYERLQNKALHDLKGVFRPELLNRIDEVVVFLPLQMEHIKQIVDLMMGKVQENLKERGLTISLTEAARTFLAHEGYDPAYGARPLRRTIQRQVENQISRGILDGTYREGDTIVLDVENDRIVSRLLVGGRDDVA